MRTSRQAALLRPPRTTFLARLRPLLGDVRLLWLPGPVDAFAPMTVETTPGRSGTCDGNVVGRLSRSGRSGGIAQSFDGATNWISFPTSANLSFGTSLVDTAFSLIVLANVTDTAAARRFVTKLTTANGEWQFGITAADTLSLALTDQSVPIAVSRISSAVITQGAFHLFGASYDGTGGATAMNGATLYQDGAVIASTATNQATYVAMEPLSANVEIGSDTAHTAAFMQGSLALVAVCAKNVSAAEHLQIAALCSGHLGAP